MKSEEWHIIPLASHYDDFSRCRKIDIAINHGMFELCLMHTYWQSFGDIYVVDIFWAVKIKTKSPSEMHLRWITWHMREWVGYVCLCVCLCEWERETERGNEWEGISAFQAVSRYGQNLCISYFEFFSQLSLPPLTPCSTIKTASSNQDKCSHVSFFQKRVFKEYNKMFKEY